MKMFFLFLSFLLLITSCNKDIESVANVSATSYIVINQENNEILEGKNYHIVRSVASISKMMTAIITIENCDVYQYTTVPEEIRMVDGSSIYLKPNEKIQIIDLLYGLMLRSGNDAATTLAIAVAGTLPVFVEMMNEKAAVLKMNDTYFSNPTGLDTDDSGNMSSAYDMAILHAYGLNNELYAQIVSTKKYKSYVNKNKLLQRYEYCTGGKTGYTLKAKRTLVSSACKDNLHLIVVTLNCGDDFALHQSRYESYFASYMAIIALYKGYNYLEDQEFYLKHNYSFMIKRDYYKRLYLLYTINKEHKKVIISLYDQNHKLLDEKELFYA